MREIARNLLLAAIAVALSFVAAEIGFRLWRKVPTLELRNYRDESRTLTISRLSAQYDPNLGWRQNSGDEYPMVHTMERGVRKNGPHDTNIRVGGVLVVGDSFAAGSEVYDPETWPALLEDRIRVPVVNAAVGGYGSDQIILMAEEMLAVARPKILLVGMLAEDILRVGYASFGRPKPYFTIEEGELVRHHNPVPLSKSGAANSAAQWPWFFGYSLIVNSVMESLDGPSWYALPELQFTRVQTDEIEVTCRLLKGLKRRTDRLGVRTLLVLQYGGGFIRASERPPGTARHVAECARAMGIQIVDEFETLKAIFRKDPQDLRSYYVMRRDTYGHMSAKGNAHIADLVAKALAEPPSVGDASGYSPEPFVPGDGVNRVPEAEKLDTAIASSSIASFSAAGDAPVRSYRVAATGGQGEHYVGLSGIGVESGHHTLSIQVKPTGASHFRVQLLDERSNGALADVNLDSRALSITRLGSALKASGGVTELSEDWRKITLTTTLVGTRATVLIQLLDAKGESAFSPKGEAVVFRALQVERGQSATRYSLLGE